MTQENELILDNINAHFKALKEPKATKFANAKEGAQISSSTLSSHAIQK